MTIDPDPFRHLPGLRRLVLDPAKSRYRDMDMSAMDRRMRQAGYPPDWRRSDEVREATRARSLNGRCGGDLWVFAYGSLMWDPAFHFSEVRTAFLAGYRRCFCLRSRLGRGSFESPGLMAALDAGGDCHGLVFRIDSARIEDETKILWSREMIMPAYDPVFVDLQTPQGPLAALAFVINHASENYMADMAMEDAAQLIAVAEGLYGTNLDYLDNLARHIDMLDIPDEAFFRLYERACRIAGRISDFRQSNRF